MQSGQGGRGPPRPGGTWSPLPFRPQSPYGPSPPPRLTSPSVNMFAGRMPVCPRPRWPVPPPGVSPPPGPKPFRLPMHPVSISCVYLRVT
ncbi:hypothetical protein GWI33_012694 [Rhynchophorus ferrugineus]|uniref:Uncharacterized protein n=1 Tax=Rhynchophorus ferrugineus TaxID=354439 RepID=A0A834MDX9_RHYFE|nr:hypothetical protein GWI33_012694 [Rhynchophorus ferrugineus]